VAIIGASVAYHMFSSKTEADDELDHDLEQLGPLEMDPSGSVRFDYYLKILQISMYYGKKQFAPDRKEYLRKRREALSENDEKTYENLVIQMQQEEDMLFQRRLQEICERLGLSQEEFMRTSMMYQQD
jgi:acid phosphatase class B